MITYATKVAITFRFATDYMHGYAVLLFSAVLSYEKANRKSLIYKDFAVCYCFFYVSMLVCIHTYLLGGEADGQR